MDEEFRKLGLSNWLCKALKTLHIVSPSRIQREAIPLILDKNRPNVFACSQTGTGKTLAYVLPIIETLVRDPRPYYALVLAPTRELANQIHEIIKALTANTFSVKSLLIIGGQNQEEAQGLWFGKPNLVVATPGRLLDHLENRNFLDLCGTVSMIKFEMLILDEADQLISHGFCLQLKRILKFFDSIEKQFNHRRQTLLFSATLTHALEKLRDLTTEKDSNIKPVVINLLPTIEEIKRELATNESLDQRYLLCPEAIKVVYLVETILDLRFKQLIIFCRTKKEANLIHKVLQSLGFNGPEFNLNPVLLNSNLKQHLRFAALDTFRSLKSKILVTTDIANRGLDLPQVDLVINFNCPENPIIYIHRVGRTCRKPDFQIESQSIVADNVDQNNPDTEDDDDDDDESILKKQRKRRRLNKNNKNHIKLKPKLHSCCNSIYLGKAITIITQYDIDRFRSIEEFIGIKMKSQEIDEKNIPNIIKQTAIAIKDAELRIEQENQEDKGRNNYRNKRVKTK
ncbi:hypothetical protein NH340_JMT08914 [Sarcoptes scabiei]|nr:hypothetical protein NH340_JMT08914 [Sarcoptes scabiei]